MPEHHRHGALSPEGMPLTMDLEPVVCEHLPPGDLLPHAVDEDLSAAAGERAQAGTGKALEHLAERALGDLREVMDLRWREAVHIDLGETGLDVAEQLLVPLEFQRRMEATLEEDLIAADRDHLRDLAHQHFAIEDVALGMLRWPVEGAEIAHRRADVGVVDVAIDVVGPPRLGMEPGGDGVGSAADGGEVR